MRQFHFALCLAAAFAMAVPLPVVAEAQDNQPAECANDSAGAITGGIVGAILGAIAGAFLSDDGSAVATVGGAVLGGIAGHQAGKHLTCADRELAEQATAETLETGETGTWANPESGNYGEVRATGSYTNAEGRECRGLEQEVVVNGETVTEKKAACKQPDGSWLILS